MVAQRDFVASLAKGLQVLAAFERAQILGNHDLVALTGLPKATVSRFTSTLAELGYLQFDDASRKYRTGARVLGLASRMMDQHGALHLARPHMQALADELDMDVLLSTRQQLCMVLLDSANPAHGNPVAGHEDGTLLSIDTTSLGLAYLVAAPLPERVRILQALQRARQVEWGTYRADVECVHREFRANGYVVSPSQPGRPLAAVSVPIVIGSRLFVLSCMGMGAPWVSGGNISRIGRGMLKAAATMQAVIAGGGGSRNACNKAAMDICQN